MAEIQVEVVYGTPDSQSLLTVTLPHGSTLLHAIDASQIVALHPEIDLDTISAGIWGKPASRETMLVNGDRVEIYRPLLVDPKEARRQRAKKDVKPG